MSSSCDPFPRRLACCVHGPSLHLRPSHWGVVSRGGDLESRFVPCSTTDFTFWGCRRRRQLRCFDTSLRSGPNGQIRISIIHLSMRYHRLPVACASWQARSTRETLTYPTAACNYPSRPISPTHLALPSRLSHGNLSGITRRLCPPRSGLPQRQGRRRRGGGAAGESAEPPRAATAGRCAGPRAWRAGVRCAAPARVLTRLDMARHAVHAWACTRAVGAARDCSVATCSRGGPDRLSVT